MENPSDYENLNFGPSAVEQANSAAMKELEENVHRERYHLVKRVNQIPGFVKPQIGDVIYVRLGNGIKSRGRAGLRFESSQKRRPIKVIKGTEDEVRERQIAGADVVSVWGAYRLYDDDALSVFPSAPTTPEVEDLQQTIADQAAELAALRKERAQEDERRAKREARQNAPESRDGKPTRLQAAAAAGPSVAEEAVRDTEINFGGDAKPAK